MSSCFSCETGKIIPLSYENCSAIFTIKSMQENIICPNCGSHEIGCHENHSKTIHGGSFNETPVYYDFLHRRFICKACGTTFMERFESLPLYARKLMDMEYAIIHAMAKRTLSDVADSYGISPQTICRIMTEYCKKEEELRLKGSYRYLSMDEIFYKRTADGEALYYWVLNDISDYGKATTIMIEIGRNKEAVINRLEQLSNPQKIIAVCIDMWRPYLDAIEKALPNAFVVIDGFHVLQLAEREFEKLRKRLGNNFEEKKTLKTDAKLLTTNLFKLNNEAIDKVGYYLKLYPELEKAYFLHQELYEFYHLRDYEQAFQYIVKWSEEVLNSGIQELKNVLNAIENWLPYIMNKFIYRISNGKTEGKNNLIRTIRRQGFHYGLITLRARIYEHDERQSKKRWKLKQKKYMKKHTISQSA
jgi:transposase